MNEFIFEKVLGFAKSLRIFDPFSIPIILLAAFISSIITFHLRVSLMQFLIQLPTIEVPILGSILGREYDLIPALNEGAIGLIIWFFLFWIGRRILDSFIDQYLIWLSKRQVTHKIDFTKINSASFSNNWIIQGSPILLKGGLAFTNSNSGCLIKSGSYGIFSKNLKKWKNFQANIKLDFIPISHTVNEQILKKETEKEKVIVWKQKSEEFRQVLGIVFRAQTLEDYFMIEVWKVGSILSFRPHIRMSGNWDAPVYNAPFKIVTKKSNITINLKAENNVVYISAGNTKVLEWALPKEFEANLLQHPQQLEDLKKGVTGTIPFRNKVGMFGFRNYGNEIAIIKDLEIKPL